MLADFGADIKLMSYALKLRSIKPSIIVKIGSRDTPAIFYGIKAMPCGFVCEFAAHIVKELLPLVSA